jgi:hypothetical protein
MVSKTKKAWIGNTYRNMKTHAKNRGMTLPNFSQKEFEEWINNQDLIFNYLFKRYINSNYKKDFVPSINRLDDYKSYSFDNIELTTWEDNNIKGRKSKKTISRVHKKLGKVARDYYKKPVGMFQENKLLKKYDAIRDATPDGFDSSAIVKCCKNKLNTHKGFSWRYLNEY